MRRGNWPTKLVGSGKCLQGQVFISPGFPTMIRHRHFHRAVFVAAGLYNIAWGVWSAIDPQWLFRFSGLPPLNHPAVFSCLAMVVGLYGVLYLEVAREPKPRLGLGRRWSRRQGAWPDRLVGAHRWWSLAAGDDGSVLDERSRLVAAIWLYLKDAWPHYKRSLCTPRTRNAEE